MSGAQGVFALRYAYRTASVRGEHFYGHPDGCLDPWPIDYFTWAVLDGDRTVVVDTGFTPETAAARGNRPYLATPIKSLGRLGRDPEDVTDVVVTHLHYDHTGHLDGYPKARIWLQRSELEFWSSPMAGRPAFAHLLDRDDLRAVKDLAGQGRVELLDGDGAVGAGITLHHVGGHTPGMQVVRVVSDDGAIVLASDASHFYANVEEDKPYGVVYCLTDMYGAFDRLHELAGPDGLVVPGHDPRVADRHPPVPGTDDLVYDLARTYPQTEGEPDARSQR
ncbi:N-acyl homoserine lactonase family protein [Georgenia halophila]|uniref:N-acyl homoserine lactonase family protein n=1 Tax=Georgenia halophila TaxID=620889 RepID=A0ABP8KTU8_9MICO